MVSVTFKCSTSGMIGGRRQPSTSSATIGRHRLDHIVVMIGRRADCIQVEADRRSKAGLPGIGVDATATSSNQPVYSGPPWFTFFIQFRRL